MNKDKAPKNPLSLEERKLVRIVAENLSRLHKLAGGTTVRQVRGMGTGTAQRLLAYANARDCAGCSSTPPHCRTQDSANLNVPPSFPHANSAALCG